MKEGEEEKKETRGKGEMVASILDEQQKGNGGYMESLSLYAPPRFVPSNKYNEN